MQVMVDAPMPPQVDAKLREFCEPVAWSAEPASEMPSIEGIFTYSHPPVGETLLAKLPSVRIASNHGVGIDHYDVEALQRRGIVIGNTPNVLNGAVADVAFGLLLACARRFPESIEVARNPPSSKFDQTQLHGTEVHGKRLGILGMGRIGQEIARRASGFRMSVAYHQRSRSTDAEVEFGAQYVSFESLLSSCDFLAVAVPLTEQTRGLIGAQELARMQSHTVIVNIARGAIIDTEALVKALADGKLQAAGLDVTDPEPLPAGHPLLGMQNVIVTSHIGSAARETRQAMADLAIENLRAGLLGGKVVFEL